MKPKGPLRFIVPVVQYGLCLIAILYLINKVSWHDHVRLNDPAKTQLRLVAEHEAHVVVLRNGRQEPVPLEQVNRVAGGEVLDIEYGVASVVRGVDAYWAALAFLFFLPAPLLQAVRLVWMLEIQGVGLSRWRAIKLTFAGNFFNFALPGTTGGDLIKAYYIARFTHHKTEAVTTVFLDRVIGLLGLVILAGAMIIIAWDPRSFGRLATVLLGVIGVLALGACFVFSRRLRHLIRLPQLAARLPAGEHLLRIGRAMVAIRQHPALVVAALVNTVVLQAFVLVSSALMGRALGMDAQFHHYFIYVPIGFLIAAIPISPPQAFGVLEWAYVQFFAHTGLSTVSQAVVFALAMRVVQLVYALPGVLVPLLGAHLPSAGELESLERAADAAAPPGLDASPPHARVNLSPTATVK
ncbi:MAG: YbhN family protein [Phycisphaerae bacterium]